MKMRIETGDAVNLIKRRLRSGRQRFQFGLRQESVAELNSPQVVEDHGAPSRAKSPRGKSIARAARSCVKSLANSNGTFAVCKLLSADAFLGTNSAMNHR